MPDSASRPNHSVKTIERAFCVLKAFDGAAAGVTDIARRTGLHKSTASRLLLTLEQLGAVARDAHTDKYRLGPELARLAAGIPFFDTLIALARPIISDLAEATRETVNLCLPQGDRVVHADQVVSPYLVGRRDWVGQLSPMHCASNGKVLLAFRPEAEILRYLSRPLERLTAHTITDSQRLREELAQARANGYAWGLEELEMGLIGVSAPVFDAAGVAVASVNVSGPAYRFPPEQRPELTRLTVEAARKISEKIRRPMRAV